MCCTNPAREKFESLGFQCVHVSTHVFIYIYIYVDALSNRSPTYIYIYTGINLCIHKETRLNVTCIYIYTYT